MSETTPPYDALAVGARTIPFPGLCSVCGQVATTSVSDAFTSGQPARTFCAEHSPGVTDWAERVRTLEAEIARMRPVFDAALLLAMTPSTHPLYEERKSDSWALAFDEARKRGVQCDAAEGVTDGE